MAEAGLIELQLAELKDSALIILSAVVVVSFAFVISFWEWRQGSDDG